MYARVCRELADAPAVSGVVEDVRWDAPIRLLGAMHYLALRDGLDPWSDATGFVVEHADFLAPFVAEQPVQTNEVQRCWALLPAFLSLGEGPLDLIELGPSGGLNLVWDRYRYVYDAGQWGDPESPVVLSGEERAPVTAALLTRSADVRRRRGVDLAPVDVGSEEGARLLSCFLWADQAARLDRLRRAIEVVRSSPPELIRGDYVELLPALLADRSGDALTVVFQTASTQYLSRERYAELRRALDAAEPPLAWISTRRHHEEGTELRGGYELEVALRLERGPALVARMGYHGQWLEWRG
jgi:hypothetical protein